MNTLKWDFSSDTTAVLKQTKELPNGIYNVPIDVKDLQGFGETQTAKVRICDCTNGVCLAKRSSVSLGPLALLAMLLPLALLLLLCESLTALLPPAESRGHTVWMIKQEFCTRANRHKE